MPSKADRIRHLGKHGYTTREIADVVGCVTAYVRVCLRQRVGGPSEHDKNYALNKYGSWKAYYKAINAITMPKRIAYYRKRRAEDPEFRLKCREWARAWRQRARASPP